MFSTLQAFLSVLLPAAVVAGAKSAGGQPTSTLDNLQAAFEGESNARHKYLAFAKKADEEGYGEVASLFRAGAKAEEFHANNHAVVIRKLGAEPKATILDPEVKSTRENLQEAITGESYERDVMYPQFIAEAKHAELYAEALKNLENLRGKSRQYFVCQVCGYTTQTLNFLRCLVCGEPKEKYITVS